MPSTLVGRVRAATMLGVLGIVAIIISPGASQAQPEAPLLVHMVVDANKNDADACVGFNLAWVAVEQGQPVEMLFDSWAGYNVKKGDFWEQFRVPSRYRQIIIDAVGHDIDWQEGSYMDLLKYLHAKGMAVSANRSFLALSNDEKKLPKFVEQLPLDQVLDHIRSARGYARY